jgi:hypothetical protein
MRPLVLLVTLLAGCAASHPESPRPLENPVQSTRGRTIVWSQNLAMWAWAWRLEVDRRFPGATILCCHGGDSNGTWRLSPDYPREVMTADAAAQAIRDATDPWRAVVIIGCNPGHSRLHVAGVWYPTGNVWYPPDVFRLFPHDRLKEPGGGIIDEFIEGAPRKLP